MICDIVHHGISYDYMIKDYGFDKLFNRIIERIGNYMKYVFEVEVYTDGDFCFPFIPSDMKYDGGYRYNIKRTYKDRNSAINDIKDTCVYLKHRINTHKDYVKEWWDECIDNFLKALEGSNPEGEEFVYEYMSGNYNGTYFKFYTEEQWINCGFHVTDEECELIKKGRNKVTEDMIKEVVLPLYK